MGASGSGKSTLLTIAGSLEDPTSGEVSIGGRSLSSLSRNGKAQLRRQSIGYVFQDYNLLAGLSAVENVSLPLELDGVAARKAQAAALESLEDFGLADRASHYPDQLSGGERQRVAIARAVVGGRQLLLADEPSGALDSTNAESVMRLILAACHRGLAAVVVTHDAQLASWADRVIFLRDGRIVDQTLPLEEPRSIPRRRPEPMSVGVLERPATGSAPTTEQRRHPGPPGHGPLGLAPLPARVAPTAAHPPPHCGGGGRRRRRRRGRGQHAAAAKRRVRHGPRPRDLQPVHAHQQGTRRSRFAHVQAQIATLEHRFGRVQVIENETFNVPGSNQTYQLRSQDPHGPYGGPMLQLLSGQLPDRFRPGCRHARTGVRAQPLGGRHVAAGRQDRRRHCAEPAEPAGRVRVGPARPGHAPDPGQRPLRRIPVGGQGSALLRHAGRVDQHQRHQPVDHRAGAGDGRHAADRPGVDRWLHRAGPAPHALPRDARVDGGDRPQCPARPGGQRRHRRRRGRRPGLRARPGALVGLPPAQRAECAPRHRTVRACPGT